MKVEVKDKSPIEKTLLIEVEPKRYEKALDKIINRVVKNTQIPGFRRGKAPKAAVMRKVGIGALKRDLLEELVPDVSMEALKEKQITPLSPPLVENFADINLEEGKPLSLEITFEVKPEFELSGYKGLELIKIKRDLNVDELVEERIKGLQEQAGTLVTVEEDRPTQEGDVAYVDFSSKKADGSSFAGGSAENYYMPLEKENFIPGFVENVIGKKPGDEWSFDVTFPENYGEKSLAGEKVTFNIKLHAIMKKDLPARDDEFAKACGDFSSYEELRSHIEATIKEALENQTRNQLQEQIIAKLVEKIKDVQIPPALIKMYFESYMNNLDNQLRQAGKTMEEHLKELNTDINTLSARYYPQAVNAARQTLILDKVGQLEKIEVTEADINEEIEKFAKRIRKDIEVVKKAMEKENFLADLKYEIRNRKTFDVMLDSAIVTEKSPEEILGEMKQKADEQKVEKEAEAKKTKKESKKKEEEAVSDSENVESTEGEKAKKTRSRKKAEEKE